MVFMRRLMKIAKLSLQISPLSWRVNFMYLSHGHILCYETKKDNQGRGPLYFGALGIWSTVESQYVLGCWDLVQSYIHVSCEPITGLLNSICRSWVFWVRVSLCSIGWPQIHSLHVSYTPPHHTNMPHDRIICLPLQFYVSTNFYTF